MADDPLTPWVFAFKLLLNGAVLLAIGLAVAKTTGVIAADDRQGWRPAALWLAGSVVVLAGVKLFLGLVQLNSGVDGALAADLIAMLWRFQGVGVSILMAGALITGLGGRTLPALGAALMAASYGLGGHSHGLTEPGLAPAIAGIHVLIAAFWITAPLVLWPRKAVSNSRLSARLERFGVLARWAVPLLFVGGGWLAWRLVGSVEALVGSTYGQLLLVKLAAATMALALGALNTLLVARAMTADEGRGRHILRVTLGLDAILFSVALAMISAATSFVGPPGEG